MDTARIFHNGNSQAVRLPKAYRFSDDEVVIVKVAGAVLLFPKRHRKANLQALLDLIGPMEIEREQPSAEENRDFS